MFRHILCATCSLGAGDQARGTVLRCVTLVDGHESSIITFIYLNHFVFFWLSIPFTVFGFQC